MPSNDNKAHFEARDVSPTAYKPESSGEKGAEKKYMGPERRRDNRRTGRERRTEVRFEPDKEDRRKNHGRRHDDEAPTFW